MLHVDGGNSNSAEMQGTVVYEVLREFEGDFQGKQQVLFQFAATLGHRPREVFSLILHEARGTHRGDPRPDGRTPAESVVYDAVKNDFIATAGTVGTERRAKGKILSQKLDWNLWIAEFIGQVDSNKIVVTDELQALNRKDAKPKLTNSTPGKSRGDFKMKLTTLCAALLIAASVNVAGAGLFKHRSNDCCAPAPTCCAPAPSCAAPACAPACAAPAAAACAPACAAPAAVACAPACAAPAAVACAPACAAPAAVHCAPACAAPAPSDCCAPVSHCGKKKQKLAGWFKGLKCKHRKVSCCDDGCGPAPCAPNCAAPACAPACAAPGACN